MKLPKQSGRRFYAAVLSGAVDEDCLRLLKGCAQQPLPSSAVARKRGGVRGRFGGFIHAQAAR